MNRSAAEFLSDVPERSKPSANVFLGVGGEEPKKGMVQQGWDALKVPEQKSREGLQMIAKALPESYSGNPVRDTLVNTPRIAAETLSEVAPGFVSRGSLLTAGASKLLGATAPAVKFLAKGAGSQLENASGIAPKAEGALNNAYNDASLFFAKGRDSASPMYEAAKEGVEKGTDIFKGMFHPDEIIKTASDYLNKGGNLEPTEALKARKAVDIMMKSGRYVKDELIAMRNTFDQMAKASPELEQADQAYSRGVQAEALRNILPQNKTGGASVAKSLMGKMMGVGSLPLVSPMVQGVAATGAGIVGRNVISPLTSNPDLAAAAATAAPKLSDMVQNYRKKKNQ